MPEPIGRNCWNVRTNLKWCFSWRMFSHTDTQLIQLTGVTDPQMLSCTFHAKDCVFLCLGVCVCVFWWSTTRQVHGKVLAPVTDKTTSGTGVVELMGEKRKERKKGKARKQLSLAGGKRESEGKRWRRGKLNSRRVGVGVGMNERVVNPLCPAAEWSVSKLSSSWWFTAPRLYQLK